MKILIIAGTNFELYYLSSVASLLKSRDESLDFNLLLRHIYDKNLTPEIKKLYSKIDLFEIPPLTFPISKNPLKTISNFFENISLYLKFRNYIKRNIPNNIDIICISCFREFVANVLCKIVPKNVRLVALRMADQKVEESTPFKKKSFFSFLLNIKNFLLGYSIMEYKWRTDTNNWLVSKNFIKYPYHRTISITDHNIGKENSSYRLPPPSLYFWN